ncbi:MAG: F0F1 ATP synthase subunit gamma [Desulfatibacillaceae bacterium]
MAESLQSLKKRLDSTGDLHSVVKTMKALAAVNIRQYEAAVQSLADYYRTVELALAAVLRRRGDQIHTHKAPALPLAAVVIGSDQGMCGQLNDAITEYAINELDQAYDAGPEQRKILALGERPASRLDERGVHVDEIMHMPDSADGINASVQDILVRIEQWGAQDIHRVVLFHTRHESAGTHYPVTMPLLPVDEIWLRDLEDQPWPTKQIPGYREERRHLFGLLISQYLFVSIFRALAESLASENASRLRSMQNAERNIEEQLEELTSRYHQQRQMAITEELLDIAAGFEALKG